MFRYPLSNPGYPTLISVTPGLTRGPDREEDVGRKFRMSVIPACPESCFLLISNPGYPSPVPSLAIPLGHKGDSSGGAHVPLMPSFVAPASARALPVHAPP